jgi:hypothetical protein
MKFAVASHAHYAILSSQAGGTEAEALAEVLSEVVNEYLIQQESE